MEAILGVKGHRAAHHNTGKRDIDAQARVKLFFTRLNGSGGPSTLHRPVLVRLMLLQRENSVLQRIVSDLFDKRHNPTVAQIASHSPEAAYLVM